MIVGGLLALVALAASTGTIIFCNTNGKDD